MCFRVFKILKNIFKELAFGFVNFSLFFSISVIFCLWKASRLARDESVGTFLFSPEHTYCSGHAWSHIMHRTLLDSWEYFRVFQRPPPSHAYLFPSFHFNHLLAYCLAQLLPTTSGSYMLKNSLCSQRTLGERLFTLGELSG